ncbi:hypothetical protein C0993_008790 [Termitomyces sp. T159_Od127]|nr:hypothetical protein C0993_008790 [Termitomyces sp. T159_Od127]
MPPTLKNSNVTPGAGLSSSETKLPVGSHGPNHERAISTLNFAIQTINHVNNAIPLLVVKGVLSSIAGILDIVKNAFANQDDFKEIAEQCQMIGLMVWRSTFQIPEHQLQDTVRRALTDLKRSVDEVQDAVKKKAKKNLWSKAFHATVNQETILKWRNELNRYLTELNIANNLKLDKLLAEFQEFRMSGTSNHLMSIQEAGVLPVRPRIFVGRDELVKSATQVLLELRHVALIGPGGIGKSHIARAILNDEAIASKFRDRRFFVRFDDMDARQINIGTFLDRVARALGFATSVNVHNLISKALSTSYTLLVLDNAETFLDAPVDAGRIADVIDGFGARLNVAILLTTRTVVLPPNIDWVRLRVPVLDESSACEAFKAYYPSIETSILIKLLAAVDFHPLSINLLAQAAVQNEWSPQDLVTAWDCQCAALLEAGNGKVQSLAVTIETSLNSPSFVNLGEMIHHLLHIIAFLPQGISKTWLTSVIPEIVDIHTCADALCRQSLAYLNGDFITLLAPIRLYITGHYNKNISINPLYKKVQLFYAARVQDAKTVIQDNLNIEHVLIHWLKASEATADVLSFTANFVTTLTHYCCRSVSLYPVVSTLPISKLYSLVSCLDFSIRTAILPKSKIGHEKSCCLLAISHLLRSTGQMERAEETLAEARNLTIHTRDSLLLGYTDFIFAYTCYKHGNYLVSEYTLKKALKKMSWVSAVFSPSIRNWRRHIKAAILCLHMIRGLPGSFQTYFDILPMLRNEWYRGHIGCVQSTAGFNELHNNHLDVAKFCFEEMQAGMDEDEPNWMIGCLGLAEVADQQCDYFKSKMLRSQVLELVQKAPDKTAEYVSELTALLAGYFAMEKRIKEAQKLILAAVKNASFLPLNAIKCKYLGGMVELAHEDFDKAENYFCEAIEDCILFAEFLYHARSHRALGEIALVQEDIAGARKHFDATVELCKTMGLPKERLYFDYACCIPNESFDGWKLYQEGHIMFQVHDITQL